MVRRYGHFDTAEDATQEALLAAAMQWPTDGVPGNPKGWLITAGPGGRPAGRGGRRLAGAAVPLLPSGPVAGLADRPDPAGGRRPGHGRDRPGVPGPRGDHDPAHHPGQAAHQGQRHPLRLPPAGERGQRLAAVLHVLYLIFNEGYASTAGPELHREELSAEAIRLARLVHRLLPDDPEVAGLLALMLLTDARRPARTGPGGELVPMADQDRSRWDAAAIAEGVALITGALPRGPTGPYQLQAAIAAVHDEAPSAQATDWPQIVALYELLQGLQAAERIAGDHRLQAARAHLLELAGDR